MTERLPKHCLFRDLRTQACVSPSFDLSLGYHPRIGVESEPEPELLLMQALEALTRTSLRTDLKVIPVAD
jgi:hypothetical protein